MESLRSQSLTDIMPTELRAAELWTVRPPRENEFVVDSDCFFTGTTHVFIHVVLLQWGNSREPCDVYKRHGCHYFVTE